MRRESFCTRLLRLAMAGACIILIGGCSTTGQSFDSSALSLMTPGETTLREAAELLNAEPVETYWQGHAGVLVRWSHKASLLTDAIYFRRELWLRFHPDGTFDRVVERVNVPSQPQDVPKETVRLYPEGYSFTTIPN